MAPPVNRKLRLTDTALRKLSSGRAWDTDIGGFGVKVYPSGKVQFILRYRSRDKRQREFRIGQFGVIDGEEARRRAKVLLGKVCEGHDPALDRRTQLSSTRTFDEVIDRYLAWAATNHKPTSLAEVSRYIRLHIRPRFGASRVADLTTGGVQQVYDRIKHGPHFRAKIITWSRTIWAWGEKRDLVGTGRNPFMIDLGVRKARRSRVLCPEEYQRLWSAIESHRHRGAIRNVSLWVIEFLMLSPIRKTEAFRLRWENVDLEARVIRLAEHKTDSRDGTLTVYISEPLATLLGRIPRSCEWVFPAPDAPSGHVMSVDKAWSLIRRRAGLDKGDRRATLHDLRRSWNSVGATLGYGPEAMGKVLGNSTRVNEAHYWHLASEIKREITHKIADRILGLRSVHSAE